MLFTSTAYSQCVAEIKDVLIDDARGSIIFETEYKLNGVTVDTRGDPCVSCVGRTRYTEEVGTKADIVLAVKTDIDRHCSSLIIRNAIKVNDLNEERLNIQKALTTPLVPDLKTNAIGFTRNLGQTVINYKNKEITVNADGTYTVIDAP